MNFRFYKEVCIPVGKVTVQGDLLFRNDLSAIFINSYNNLLPSMRTDEDRRLFVYYKGYRSNIRAKVNSLRARKAGNDGDRKLPLAEAGKYLSLMDRYMKALEIQ